MYSTAIRPVHQSKATVETSRLHIGFACIRAHPEALEADFQCLSRISSQISSRKFGRWSQNEGTSVVPGSQGRVAGVPRHIPEGITASCAGRVSLRS